MMVGVPSHYINKRKFLIQRVFSLTSFQKKQIQNQELLNIISSINCHQLTFEYFINQFHSTTIKRFQLIIIKFMMQNNHLYRRIQHKNLFRTFSRTYSRQTQARRLRSQNKQPNQTQPNHSTSTPFIQNNSNQSLNQTKTNAFQHSSQRLEMTSQTAPIFKRTDGFCNKVTPFSSTAHIQNFLPQSTNFQKYSHNSYLNTLLQKRKQSGSAASNMSHFVLKQNFKLKSCSQAKRISYEGDTDQTDFSILEYNRRFKMKKQMQQRQQRQTQNLARMELIKGTYREPNKIDLKTKVGKRITAHLFNKYNKTVQGFINISKKENGTKSFDN